MISRIINKPLGKNIAVYFTLKIFSSQENNFHQNKFGIQTL